MSPQQDNGATSGGRKPGRNLSSLLSSRSAKEASPNSRWTFSKSPAPIAEIKPQPAGPRKPAEAKQDDAPPSAAAVDKRQSKMSLFDLFSKPKVERARGFHESGGESIPERSQTPAHFYRNKEKPRQPEAAAMIRPRSRTSGRRTPSQRAGAAKPERPPPDDWVPPPLFQAYPQAIKHGVLQGTTISAETLLRAAHYKNHDGFGSMVSLPFVSENGDDPHPTGPRHGQKRFSTLADSLEIGKKVFVLTTTGRIVQYAGDGNYDRLPEKILQLCHNSAAFACDLIPGKHWVLQVLQTVNQDGAPAIKQSRSLLSRLRVPSAATRKHATGLLMIFSNAEDMDSWLKALRKAIEQLGGKRIEPDPEPRIERPVKTLTKMPSHRYQVHRDPRKPQPLKTDIRDNRPASIKSTGTSILHSPVDQSPTPHLPSPKATSARASPSESPQPALAERSGQVSRVNQVNSPELSSIGTAVSSDQVKLEQLRDSSRHSFISTRTSRTSETEAATRPTSRGSSSPPSLRKESFTEPDTQRTPPGLKAFALSPGPNIKPRRTSLQAQAMPGPRTSPQRAQRDSAIGVATISNSHVGSEPPSSKPVSAPSPINNLRGRTSKLLDKAASRNSAAESIERPISTAAESEDGSVSTRPTSTIGQLPNISQRSLNRIEQRTEPPRKPFVRPIPVKPSEPASTQQRRASGNPETLRSGSFGPAQNRTSGSFAPRRLSSFPVTPMVVNTTFPLREKMGAGPIPPIRTSSRSPSISYSVAQTAKSNSPLLNGESSPSSNLKSPTSNPSPTNQTLRRPNSMQIRSDPAPFLSSRQPQSRNRSYRSASASPTPYARSAAHSSLFAASLVPSHPGSLPPPPIPPMNPSRPGLRIRSSMSTIVVPGMPPPAHPPPNIPLPKLPDGQAIS